MLHFDSDYMEGAHPAIMKRLMETNMEQTPGYGTDEYSNSAKEKIKKACNAPEAEVFFLMGGTQTNRTAIDGILRGYEGVLAAECGHISVHESGAIEAGGHKVLALPHERGKLKTKTVEDYLARFYQDANWPHMVIPGMLYVSHPTEYGAIYTKAELEGLHEVCKRYHIPMYIDGARLGYGLAADNTDVTLSDIARCCEAFYIGGTKVGALFGEALVFTNTKLVPHFFTTIKQHGGLLAKGRLLGLQFDTLFTDDLYMKISRRAIERARELKAGLKEKGYELFFESPTNQQFLIMENKKIEELKEKVSFGFWEVYDEKHTVVRIATGWATESADIRALLKLL
ncbi:L-threonine aldolase [Kineothrix alysoides]|uniref:L-threonine aldolase n=1 Tax=Kineothrix alysoides TaxID=1469948 RepID=A0A4R1QSK5_9FIRM|nr:beta-eliminating lyase-related protein [Kineothrix alysoides]TCL55435.1 L-threonine aldolase [Kineothrix alysoides]